MTTGLKERAATPGAAVPPEREPRTALVITALGVGLVGVLLLSVGLGEYQIAPRDVLSALRLLPGAAGGEDAFIVTALRLPRALVAMAVGVGLGLSGALLQGITRNPLAAPSILGITQGAGLAAVLVVVAAPGASGWVPPAAFAGAMVAALLVYALAWRGGASPTRLVLVGVGVAALGAALTTVVVTFGNIHQVQAGLVWLVGSVRARGWPELQALLPWLVVFVPVAWWSARSLDALELGDAVARALGVRVELQRAALLLAAVALAGSSVAIAGTVGFVGLMAPHLSRRLVGPGYAALIPTTALLGALLVAAADLVGRTALAPLEIPCGIVTSILGAPYFVYLLYRGGAA